MNAKYNTEEKAMKVYNEYKGSAQVILSEGVYHFETDDDMTMIRTWETVIASK